MSVDRRTLLVLLGRAEGRTMDRIGNDVDLRKARISQIVRSADPALVAEVEQSGLAVLWPLLTASRDDQERLRRAADILRTIDGRTA